MSNTEAQLWHSERCPKCGSFLLTDGEYVWCSLVQKDESPGCDWGVSEPAFLSVEWRWRYFWRDIVAPDGEVDLELIKRELSDYHAVMISVSIVYDELTGGRISKPNTDSSVVIAEVRDCFAREEA